MTTADADRIYIAVSTGTELVDGKRIAFTKDKTLVRGGHPLLKSCPSYFVPFGEFLDWSPKR